MADRLQAPQGLAVDGADNLYYSEEDAGRVDLLVRTFKLRPLPVVAESATQPLCIDLSRAAGFNGAISLSGSDGLRVLQQPGGGSTGAVLVTGCATSPCALTAHSGARSDVLWIRAHA